jgi:FtsP/CotA-like multicopper oxidase with cupredoxin domain
MKTFFLLIIFFSSLVHAKTVHYELTIKNEKMNLSGKKDVDFALTVNGGIPAPTLEFTEGDDAEILVKNEIRNEEVSVHWHGILLPPKEDGVAYINTPPIHPGSSRLFKFKVRQNGTYWYHSHTGLQEQKGVYGAIVIHPKQKTIPYDKDLVVMISDWSDENPDQIIKNLKKDGDYYLYKKGTVRSYFGAVKTGELKNYLSNEWQRMGGMDLSDVGYDAFLINGKRDSQIIAAHPGEKMRLRLINASSSSYFYVSLGQSPMKVISADGQDIEPVFTREILMGMAETYDVLFTVPEHKNYELRATAQDVTGFASGWIGMGEKVSVPSRPTPDLYATMDHSEHAGHMEHVDHAPPTEDHSSHEMHMHHMDHSAHTDSPTNVIDTLTVNKLKAKVPTEFKNKTPYDVKLALGGDMSRYTWFINGKTIDQDRSIYVNEGDVIRFTFENQTMMHHPMHLHGHFFRVLNENGSYSPLKHTVDVPPHEARTIEVLADEPGEWMFHCHNLYHMKSGMARILSYRSYSPDSEIKALQHHDPHMHEHIYYSGSLSANTNTGELRLKASQTWNELELRAETKKEKDDWENEGDLFYRRYFDQYSNLIVGGTNFHDETRAVIGFGYKLPGLIESNWLIDSRGKGRLDLGKRFQWTSTVFTDAEVRFRDGFDADWSASLAYANSWPWSVGLKFTEGNIGIGFQYRF